MKPWNQFPRRQHGIPAGPPCATCGAAPTDRYRDGSAAYGCGPHARPVWNLRDAHPAYLAWIREHGAVRSSS
jgi:hypothetical protein